MDSIQEFMDSCNSHITTTTTAITTTSNSLVGSSNSPSVSPNTSSRYENQKRRDWNTFGQYLKNHRPLSPSPGAAVHTSLNFSGTNISYTCHAIPTSRYLDQFGKTKVHTPICPFYGHPNPPAPCPCPLRQAWGSLDALIGRLRAAYEENGGKPEINPFGARAVRLYLREVRELQSKARGISYEKKKRKRPPPPPLPQQQQPSSLTLPRHHHHHHHHLPPPGATQ
ncbi:hypothetical protein ACSQ67_015129 [Phaseolus vulgaris]